VTLNIFDILGNTVETLVNEQKSKGSYEVVFEASSLSSGVYFYRLQAGAFTETKKLLLMK
ncbi:MAG: T9SS type A sorting domain-containing protein, partial [Arcobacter sp.]|nr:T9SS type A sorting domain-containing protein [Arcobacter sp.]